MDHTNDDEPNISREEKLHIENEIEKLKLSAFNDAQFFSSDKDLPPEIENDWLKYIAHFEKEWEDCDRITVAEKMGKPNFPAATALSESEIEANLDQVRQLMADHGLFLDNICEVADAELYRFITEELFQEEIDDVDIEGMQTCFIYEEFYPNDKLDIEQTIEDFISSMLSKDFRDYLDTNLAESCETADGKLLSKEEAVEKAILYSDLFDSFEDIVINNFSFDINETKTEAAADFECSWNAILNSETTAVNGSATASLRRGELGYWNIVTLKMPGFSF